MNEASIVEYFSGHDGYKCGYCKCENTCYSYGMWTHTLSPLDYQNLIDRGWRRCEAKRFTLSRSQKKVMKKVHKFLSNGEQERSISCHPSESGEQSMDVSDGPEGVSAEVLKNIKVSKIHKSDIEFGDTGSIHDEAIEISLKEEKLASSSFSSSAFDSSHVSALFCAASTPKSNSDRSPCRKAKELRRERKLQKLLNKGVPAHEAMSSIQKKGSEPKTVENFLSEPFPLEPVYKLELRLVPASVGNPLFKQTFEESYSVYKKYQMAIHKDPPEKCSESQYIRFLVKTPFQLRLVPTDFDSDDFKSTFDASFNLYKKYQMKIHNDTEDACNQESYEDFLVETPFERLDGVPSSEAGIYGSFHQQYWLNDKLIAVGVLDVLPYCISSVYFYYDPDYSFLSLGTYAALREIALVRELNKTHPDIQYYYMGFYIHSCVKMRYKGQYHPSYLLCPETYIFQPIEKCRPKLDIAKYHRLEEDPNKEDIEGIVHFQEIVVLHSRKKMTYLSYKKMNKHAGDEALVEEYARFVGRKCYRRMMLFRN